MKTFFTAPTKAMALAAALLLAFAAHAQMNHTGLNLSGDASLAATQKLAESDSAGAYPQNFWTDAPGLSGEASLEIDGGTSIPVFYSGYTARWQGAALGSSSASGLLPNAKLMKGSLLGAASQPVIIQINGLPLPYRSGGYALVVHADVPGNTSNIVLKATLEAGAATGTLYLRDAANTTFSGAHLRGAVTSTTDRGAHTVAGNYFLFTGLNASDIAVVIEPAESNPQAIVAVNAVQVVPASVAQALAPRVTSELAATINVNEAFNYLITTDVLATTIEVTGLPAGLSFHPTTMRISGSAQQTGTHAVTITVRNAAGQHIETLLLTVLGTDTVELDVYMIPAVVVKGQAGQRHQVEYVDGFGNPNDWKPAGTLTLTNASEVFVDISATNQYRRFYRSRLLP